MFVDFIQKLSIKEIIIKLEKSIRLDSKSVKKQNIFKSIINYKIKKLQKKLKVLVIVYVKESNEDNRLIRRKK